MTIPIRLAVADPRFEEFGSLEYQKAVAEAWGEKIRKNKLATNDHWTLVFGSNLRGRHGLGAALTAVEQYGAIEGQGEGLQGNSFAIPTKNEKLQPLALLDVKLGVERFLSFAAQNPERKFKVTRIGCGLAGYLDLHIAPMFRQAPENCYFDTAWNRFLLGDSYHFWGTF